MTVVQNTLTDPTGTPLPNTGVLISLITTGTPPAPGYTATSSIATTEVAYTDSSGLWSANLTPNTTISPSGSYYRVTEDGQISNIRVPASGGPYNLPDLLVAPQADGTIAITGVQVAGAGTVIGVRPEINLIGGANITLTLADDSTNDRVNITVTGSGGGVQPTRLISTTAPLSGGGDLSADRTIVVNTATATSTGVMQLAGDLTGTAIAPTIAAGAITSAKIADGTIVDADISGSAAIAQSKVSGLVAGLAAKAAYRGTWTAGTTYLVDDFVTYAGAVLLCTTAHTSGPTFALTNWADLTTPAHRFNVRLYGAVGDGATNDTTAIRNAITAAVNWAQSSSAYACEVYLPAGRYNLAGSLVQGGATFGNSLLPLPVIPTTSHKVTLVFRGPTPVAAVAHWEQTVGQRAGAVLSTTVAGTQDGTYGEASVLGGPTPAQGYGQSTVVFSNMCVVIADVAISVPNDPAICGFDFRGMGQCVVTDASVLVNAAPANIVAPSEPHQWTFGLAMPEGGNNDLCDVGRFSVEGMCYGILVTEHTNIDSLRCVYTIGAVMVSQAGGHGIKIRYVSVEQSQMAVGVLQGVNGSPIEIDQLDYEFPSQAGFGYFVLINDSGNRLFGTINVVWAGGNLSTSRTMMNGGTGLRLIDAQQPYGTVTAPSVPASTTALLNPFYRHAAVTIVGGTVSAVAVDGVATGLTSGTVVVPATKTITVTYSVAPSWHWTLL